VWLRSGPFKDISKVTTYRSVRKTHEYHQQTQAT
jgi:hypothetical protein